MEKFIILWMIMIKKVKVERNSKKMEYIYEPNGVCSYEMIFEIENNIPYSFSNKEFALLTNVNLKDSLSYSLEDYDEDGELLPHVRRK